MSLSSNERQDPSGTSLVPASFVLRARADDGGLYHDADITVTVSAARSPE